MYTKHINLYIALGMCIEKQNFINFDKKMGHLKYLILHCTATKPNREVDRKDLEQWHLKERGWSKLGYAKLFQRSGIVINLYDIDGDQWIDANEMTNGAKGFNSVAVHWCFAGGLNEYGDAIFGDFEEVLTDEQFIAFQTEIKEFLIKHPQVKVLGHNQVAKKYCPGFDVEDLLLMLNIPKENIY